MKESPLVSIVTPFYNTEEYLAECIESVLAQTYTNWIYLLVDNCSTDGSSEIARKYEHKDPRINICRNEKFLTQVQNYNHALCQISAKSKYCKIVQADDWIFPNCIEEMVATAEKYPAVGIVSAYYLAGNTILNVGLPYPSHCVPGRELCRRQLLEGSFYFGSPNSILLRSDLVRSRNPFYEENRLHEDTEACYDILRKWDFSFVHQVLSFTRTDNDSILTSQRRFDPWYLDQLITLKRFGPDFLESYEFEQTLKKVKKIYFSFLGSNLLRNREEAFWKYHRNGLATVDVDLSMLDVWRYAGMELLSLLLNPQIAIKHACNYLKKLIK